jgi:hypothetical protein
MFLTKESFSKIYEEKTNSSISIDELLDKSNRTLIYGYNCDRDTFHAFIYNGKMYSCYYKYSTYMKEDYIINEISVIPKTEQCSFKELFNKYHSVPNKRVYPESCDEEFCNLLMRKDIEIPFTTFDEKRAEMLKGKKYHGMIPEEIIQI